LLNLGAIADAGLGHDDRGSDRVRLELASKASDVNAERLLRVAKCVSPDFPKELLVGQGTSSVAEQRAQNVPFGPRQVDDLVSPAHRWFGEIDDQIADANDLVRSGGSREA
jgi:hypothetical protein